MSKHKSDSVIYCDNASEIYDVLSDKPNIEVTDWSGAAQYVRFVTPNSDATVLSTNSLPEGWEIAKVWPGEDEMEMLIHERRHRSD